MPSPRNDIAIYSPYAFAFYEDRSRPNAPHDGGGGAELQTALLARHLASAGLRVAHIVYPVRTLARFDGPAPEVVQRARLEHGRGPLTRARRMLAIWRALAAADAHMYVFRTGRTGAFVAGAAFCALRRRRLVFAGSSDLDFTLSSRGDRSRALLGLGGWALRHSDAIVVQSRHQLDLARAAIGDRPVVIQLIPSFAEIPELEETPPDPEAFVWIGRMVDYKLPLEFIELARAMPEARFRMVAATTTDTSDALREQIIAGAASVHNLDLHMDLPRSEVLDLIARAVAVVSTSKAEGMPNVFLEAWARAVPVLTLHFDPDRRIAQEQLGLSATGSRERFIELAGELWEQPELRERLGQRGHEYVVRTHSADPVGTRWETILRGVLERS